MPGLVSLCYRYCLCTSAYAQTLQSPRIYFCISSRLENYHWIPAVTRLMVTVVVSHYTFSMLFSEKPTHYLMCCMCPHSDNTAVQPTCSSNFHSKSHPYQKVTEWALCSGRDQICHFFVRRIAHTYSTLLWMSILPTALKHKTTSARCSYE